MGALAKWGAIAGAAKGVSGQIERHQAEQAAERKSAADEAREMRLQKMKQTHDISMAERREEHETKIAEMGHGARLEQIGAEGATREEVEHIRGYYAGERVGAQLESAESEGAADRASREKIARIQAAASTSGARRALSRYEARVLTTGEANEYGIQIETDTPAVFDKLSAKWYLQEGDRLRFPGEKEEARRAPEGAVRALMSEPERANAFYQKYKYLPMDYLAVLNEAAASAFAPPTQ